MNSQSDSFFYGVNLIPKTDKMTKLVPVTKIYISNTLNNFKNNLIFVFIIGKF